MAISQEYPTIDGFASSWADIAIDFSVVGGQSLSITGIKSIKSSRKLEEGKQMGVSGGRVLATTVGSATHEASAVFYRNGLSQLIDALVEVAPNRGSQKIISRVRFDILVKYSQEGSERIYQRKYKGCGYAGDTDDDQDGNDVNTVDVPLNPLEIVNILENGTEIALV
jgi:hypothetical protein